MPARTKLLLPLVVFAQFAGTSLWFAGNAIIGDIQSDGETHLAVITSIVQFGFIAGTLVFSLLTLADRFPASRVFFISSCLAAASNLLLLWWSADLSWLLMIRFTTGFFLAGIYPVGMKIAADCFPERLGRALGFLVGALVLGTAFPYAIKSNHEWFAWQDVIIYTSLLAFTGGIMILFFTPKNIRQKISQPFRWNTAFTIFKYPNFRAAALGYFGHMWELYAFWAFIPFILSLYNELHAEQLNVALWSFVVIASGMIGCIIGGMLSIKTGSRKIAFIALLISGICCLLVPFSFQLPKEFFLSLMIVWGFMVVADSPQFSTMVAQSAPRENKGTALTFVTSIGFAITIVSIQLLQYLAGHLNQYALIFLAIGPLLGLMMLKKYLPPGEGR
ncbi:MAG: MFS transporter [Flavisolibacter sp.]